MESDELSSFAEAFSAHNEFVFLDDAATIEADSASAGIFAVEFGVLVVKSVGHSLVSFIISWLDIKLMNCIPQKISLFKETFNHAHDVESRTVVDSQVGVAHLLQQLFELWISFDAVLERVENLREAFLISNAD